VFRDGGDRARQVVPLTTLAPIGTRDPLDLYEYLANHESKTGGKVFALAHNGNLSNGWMFPTETTYAGGAVDEHYVKLRAQWEPLYEITQIKGDGETHPALSPDDEYADYETWDAGNLDLSVAKTEDMLQREYAREVYATTGPRMRVRFFGGWGFSDDDLRSGAPAFRGYEKGVPMGADLPKKSSDAPTFMVYALRDPIGANLDRIQIVKGWMDAEGNLQERVFDVAVSGGRTIGEDGRCKEPVGNTVDLEAANWTNTIGASELTAVWTDPEFDPQANAFYYARVLEIPTPRWVLYDKVRLGAEIPVAAELVGQERAYTSPIWYTPEG
jgi:hypothetical protein